MLLLVRRPKWLSLGRSLEKDTAPLPRMLLVKFDDGSLYVKVGKALFLLKSVPTKRRIFMQRNGEVGFTKSKHFISRFSSLQSPSQGA